MDIGPQCLQALPLCNNPTYKRLINQICPETCNFCFNSTTIINNNLITTTRIFGEDCRDMGTDCERAKPLCDNPVKIYFKSF